MTEPNQAETTLSEPSAPTAQPEQRPDHVDFNDLGLAPEKLAVLERRFTSVYGRMKDMERNFKEAATANKALLERVDEISRSSIERNADRIKAEIKSAAETGEYEKLATLTEELVKVTSSATAAKPSKAADPPQESKPEAKSPPDLSEVVGVEDEAALRRWAMEKAEDGTFVRPWLHPEHPKNQRAQSMIQAVMNDNEFKTAEDKMAEVDRLMGLSKAPRVPAVLSPSSVGNRGNATRMPQATPAQRAVAEEMGVPIEKYMAMVAASPKDQSGRMQMNHKAKW